MVTGGVLEDGLEEIGSEDVDVPRYYYKIVARGDAKNPKIIAFLLRGKESTRPLHEFAVTVDEVENRTGIDFFERLADDVESKLESEVATNEWKF